MGRRGRKRSGPLGSIEELLWEWGGYETHELGSLGGGGNPIAAMMAHGSVLIRPTGHDLPAHLQPIDRAVPRLHSPLRRVVITHYVRMRDAPKEAKSRRLRYSLDEYEALHTAALKCIETDVRTQLARIAP